MKLRRTIGSYANEPGDLRSSLFIVVAPQFPLAEPTRDWQNEIRPLSRAHDKPIVALFSFAFNNAPVKSAARDPLPPLPTLPPARVSGNAIFFRSSLLFLRPHSRSFFAPRVRLTMRASLSLVEKTRDSTRAQAYPNLIAGKRLISSRSLITSLLERCALLFVYNVLITFYFAHESSALVGCPYIRCNLSFVQMDVYSRVKKIT